VRKPGIYSIAMGTPVQVILNKAFPKKNADLQSLSLKKIISQPCSIYVECLKELSICIEGEVLNPGLFRVPFGSRISDLKHLVSVSQNADLKYFKKRRLLQDGETINIPPSQSLQKN
jgi:hypothetical protein